MIESDEPEDLGTEAPGREDQPSDGTRPAHGRNKWTRFGLPDDMSGLSFLDVGCWEGANCAEAVRRGAKQVVGLDLCTSEELAENVERFGFEFVQMDVLSEKWLELDTFDIVLCSGVLYHIENVLSLLLRLRRVTDKALYLETATRSVGGDIPVLVFKSDEDASNPSNWWVPNKRAVYDMLESCGFADVTDVFERERVGGSRLCVRATPVRRPNFERALPRKREAMSLAGGTRWHETRKQQRGRLSDDESEDE